MTGFNLRHWRHYQAVETLTRQRVVVAFVHQKERVMRMAPLQKLRELVSHTYEGPNMSSPMVFFRYAEIPVVCSISELEPSHGSFHAGA